MKEHFKKAVAAAGLSLALCMGGLAGYAAEFAVTVGAQNFIAADVQLETSGLLPLRYTAENCGYTVTWNEDESIVLEKDGAKIQMQIGSDKILVNGEESDLHYIPNLIGDKTYLPQDFYTSFFTDRYITKTAENAYTLTEKTPISADSMMNTVREISQIPRHPGDETHKDAIQYVTDKFEEYGYTVERQPFEYVDWDTGQAETGTNLIAVKEANLAPTGDVLIFGAHYDGVAGMPAANDNGSGLSVLLELARVLKDLPGDTEIRFVAFDDEEGGLYGSKEYVKRLTDTRNIIGMVNFDMLGGAKAGKVGIYTADGRNNYLVDILKRNYEFSNVERELTVNGSDHISFATRLIPVIDFSHDIIRDEYHNENDLAEHVSADMLEWAAKCGEAVAAVIMSNLTPQSYREMAKPRDNNSLFEITPETYIPTYGTTEEVRRATGAAPVQIESDSGNLKYVLYVRLFGLEQPLDMIYESAVGYIFNPYIDLTDKGLSYESVKALLDENIGGGVKIKGDEYGYFYNSVYGNRFELYCDPKREVGRLRITVGDYTDNAAEAYAVEDGGLVRMDAAELETAYEITNTKDGVSVTETAPKPSRDLEVSDRALKCWERVKPLLTAEELSGLSYFVLNSDGLGRTVFDSTEYRVAFGGTQGIEIPEEYKNLPDIVQEYIGSLLNKNMEEGTSTTVGVPLPGKTLIADANDILDERGAAYSDTDLLRAYATMKGQNLFRASNFRDREAEYPNNGTPFEKNTCSYKRDSIIYAFAERFYQEIYSDNEYRLYDLFSKYPGEFVCEDAAESIDRDMAYSFAEFVVRDKPAGDSVIEQKIRFFYNYPEYVEVREQLRQHM